MSNKAGNLLWRRMRLTLAVGVNDIDTGITQQGQAFENSSAGEPGLGSLSTVSRVNVIPLAPTALWTNVTMDEPIWNATTKTVHVVLTNNGKAEIDDLNVLIWDPDTKIGPGQADLYNTPR